MPRRAPFCFALMTALFATMVPSDAQAANVNFCWDGAGGYTMTGRMQIPDAAMAGRIVTEAEVSRFKISGYHRGEFLGTWDMRQADESTTWHLRFDPQRMLFLTGGSFPGPHSQGWNADGGVMDCGTPGFGFNSGNHAQDICVNGIYIQDSSIAPATRFTATLEPVTPDCSAALLTSKMMIRESGD